MKAKEYLAKFEADCLEVKEKQAILNLIGKYLEEVYELAKIRRVQKENAVVSIFRELNQKWNAMCRLDTKKRFKRNGFIKLVRARIVEDAPHYIKVVDVVVKEVGE